MGNIDRIKTPNAHTPTASKDVERHKHASDAQDILSGHAPPGKETTGHQKTHNTKPKRKRPGRKRGPRSMGRYPFLTLMNEYLAESALEGKAESTLRNEERMLRNLHTDMQYLKQKGKIPTTDPSRYTMDDIQVIVHHLRNRENKNNDGKLDVNTVAKYCQYLKSLVDFCDNSAMIRLQKKNKLPKRYIKNDILTLDEEDALIVFNESQKGNGWDVEVLAFIISVYLMLGLRASELRRAELGDINQRKWTFFVRYPKGGQQKQTTMKIPKALIPHFQRYLEAREKELEVRDVYRIKTLVPKLTKNMVKDHPYTASYYWKLKRNLEDKIGFQFDFQMLRRTSGQFIMDADKNNLTVVSKHLRHSSTVVTQRYYAQMRDNKAAEIVDEVWSNSPFAKQS